MTNTEITIKGITETTGRSGKPYFLIETNCGKMSCFPDYEGLEDLKEAWKMDEPIEVNVETSEDGKYRNIRNAKANATTTVVKPEDFGVKHEPKANKYEPTSMYVSYAKDIFCEILKDHPEGLDIKGMMQEAIDLVKQARESFS